MAPVCFAAMTIFNTRKGEMHLAKIQTLNPPALEPSPAYEHAHLIARDLITHIERQLDRMIRPESKDVRWFHLRAMNLINAQLSEVATAIDETNNIRN